MHKAKKDYSKDKKKKIDKSNLALIKTKNKKRISISNVTYTHILIMLLGTILIIATNLHTNTNIIEEYSIAMSKLNLNEIIKGMSYGTNPVLYYLMLHIVSIITNGSIICQRLFSCIPIIILSLLGYTHIRKDYNSRTGLVFSFLSITFPTIIAFSGEISMYTWEMLFVTITMIYALRIEKNSFSTKNWTVYTIFCLLAAYTNYYGLILVIVTNIGLLIHRSIRLYKNKKIEFTNYEDRRNVIANVLSVIIQIILYSPWMGIMITQISLINVGSTVNETIQFLFTGNLENSIIIPQIIAIPFSIFMICMIIYMYSKNWHEDKIKDAKIHAIVWIVVVLIISIISIIKPVLNARCFLSIFGIVLIPLSILLEIESRKKLIAILSIILAVSYVGTINLSVKNYGEKENTEENIENSNICILENETERD